MKLAAEHQATEALLEESGVPFALLRNGWYLENYTEQLPATLAQVPAGSAGDGKISAAARADYAEAAAAVLIADGQAGKVYELGGDEAFTMAELAGGSAPRPTGPSATRTCPRRSTPQCWQASVCPRTSRTSWRTRTSGLPAAICTSPPRTSAGSLAGPPRR